MTARSGDLPYEAHQFIVGGSSACAFGCAEFCGGWIVRHLHLYHEQLCVVAAGESGSPADGAVGAFRTVGAYHHTPYGIMFRLICHTSL
jgi:hypothetical protein